MSETEYEIYFAGIDWGATFDLFPQVEITYDPDYEELTKNENKINFLFIPFWLCDLFRLWYLPELEQSHSKLLLNFTTTKQ